jgi:riboflavin kinase/FMN adenylyltransferase
LRIFRDIEKFSVKNPVVSLGVFDGVHVGHKKIVYRLNELASEYNSESLIITFWPHPKDVLHDNDSNCYCLTTREEKEALLNELGVDNLIVIQFTRELAQTSFRDFVRHYLINKINTKHLVVGFNHHFGKDRKGNYEYLKKVSGEYGFTVEQLSPVIVMNSKVSSSVIRRNLEKGSIEMANTLLGYLYFINGRIVPGERIGRKMGFPTANISLSDNHKLLPGDGVYAVRVFLQGNEYNGMLNIGTSPTIEEKLPQKTIEVHIIDFQREIYNKEVNIRFIKRLRDEKKFDSDEKLIEQLKEDKNKVVRLLSK